MPRYRKLHTKITESLDVNEMPDDFTRLFWVLLPLALCRQGRGISNPAWLKSKVFPLREDVTTAQVARAFDWLVGRRMVKLYTVDRRDYFYIPSWDRYQGDTSKEAESDYPAPPVESNSIPTPELVPTNSIPTPELVPTYSPSDADATADATADADATTTAEAIAVAVAVIGFDPAYAPELVAQYGPGPVLAWAAAIPRKKGIRDRPAFVRSELEKGHAPPLIKMDNERNRFTEGEFAEYIQH